MYQTLSTLRTGAALAALALGLTGLPAQADEADALRFLKSMSDYMAGETSFSFNYDATLEVVTTEDQKLGLASSGTVTVARPDKMHATRTGGFTDVEMTFDGEVFSLLGKQAVVYTQLPIKGSVDQLIDLLRVEYGRPLPAADLLTSGPYDILMSEVTDVKDIGAGVIAGQTCNHLAFRTPDVDWQIWIATGEQPYPCRYVITTRSQAQGPQYSVDIRDWQSGQAVDSAVFAFDPPADATKINFEDYQAAVSELPAHFNVGESK